MSKRDIPGNLGKGGAHMNNDTLRPILVELQGLTFSVVAGAGIDTNIAIAGIETEDTIVGAARMNAPADLLAEASITSNGNIQFDSTDTTGDFIQVAWLNKTP